MVKPYLATLVVCAALLSVSSRRACAQGLAISGIGPVNQSMGGAATAAPIESTGALMWNPATISGLASSEISFGLALALPSARLSSTFPAGAIGGVLPPVTLSGSDESESGVTPIPNVGFVEHIEDSPWSYGLGVFGIGGFRVNYPASVSNPILSPQPPLGFGIGRTFADAEILQIAPTLSYAINERWSIGFAPTLNMAKVAVDPLLLGAPDDANGDGFFTYPSGRGNRMTWGAGFQIGVYYIGPNDWHFGAAVKSPQWFERFRIKTEDELGRPRTVKFDFTYPTIVTLGTAYSGFENWLFATDVRMFDYGNAKGFGETGFNPDGSLAGLSWGTIFTVSAGVQFKASERLYLRSGYSFNQNPISDFDSGFNVLSPTITQHFVYVGSSISLSDRTYVTATYAHGFENEVSGPIQTPLGPIPGSVVASAVSLDALAIGVTVKY